MCNFVQISPVRRSRRELGFGQSKRAPIDAVTLNSLAIRSLLVAIAQAFVDSRGRRHYQAHPIVLARSRMATAIGVLICTLANSFLSIAASSGLLST